MPKPRHEPKPKEFRSPNKETFFTIVSAEPHLVLKSLIEKIKNQSNPALEVMKKEISVVVADIERQNAMRLTTPGYTRDEGDEEAMLDMSGLARTLKNIVGKAETREEILGGLMEAKGTLDEKADAFRKTVIENTKVSDDKE